MNSVSDYCARYYRSFALLVARSVVMTVVGVSSKFGAIGFAESLRRECLGSRIRTTIVCPWIMRTGMFAGIRELFALPSLDPGDVADRVLDAVECEIPYLVVPSLFYLLPLIRLLPVSLCDSLAVLFGATTSMADFVGRGRDWGIRKL